MSNSTDTATGPVNNALSAASHAVGSAAGSVASVATRVIGSTGTDATSTADSIAIVGLQQLQTQTPRAG
jgi:hypothetical protein